MHYLQNIRPRLLGYQIIQSDKLFLPLPKGCKDKAGNNKLLSPVAKLMKQIRTIDRQFLNFKQVRTSVITFWIKTYGLRKAQYMAGHRYISSTENYLPNDLEDLIEDINTLHPF
jgi:hypothetical protein